MSSKGTGSSIPTDPINAAQPNSSGRRQQQIPLPHAAPREPQGQISTGCCALGYEVAAGTGGTVVTVAGWPLEEADRLQQHRG